MFVRNHSTAGTKKRAQAFLQILSTKCVYKSYMQYAQEKYHSLFSGYMLHFIWDRMIKRKKSIVQTNASYAITEKYQLKSVFVYNYVNSNVSLKRLTMKHQADNTPLRLAIWVECSPVGQETEIQSQVKSYQRLKQWYLMLPIKRVWY